MKKQTSNKKKNQIIDRLTVLFFQYPFYVSAAISPADVEGFGRANCCVSQTIQLQNEQQHILLKDRFRDAVLSKNLVNLL